MWNSCNNTTDSVADFGTSGYVAGKSYAPNWNLGCGTEAGKPALNTDHRPVGVRLRVMDEGDVGGPGSCAHPICTQGSSLANGCDAPVNPPSCVSTICASDPFCCGNSWDSACVNEVASLCGKMCNAPSAGWTPFVSEEQAQGTTCGEDGNFVTAAKCRGDNCDDMSLYCSPSPAGLTTTPANWTTFISEEAPTKSLTCDSNSSAIGDLAISSVIDGIRATGSYADNVSVHCANLPSGHQLSACEWTPYFSEEAGTQVFPAGKVAAGIRCRGSYCDDLSYFVCAVN
jgi:hypothetical protein